jgi:8-oxo-dGTP diphosphatase
LGATVRVVAAALFDAEGRVLIAQRLPGKHLAGRWEFPGGKIADGEDEGVALVRELAEELGIRPCAHEPLMALTHDYPDRRVELRLHVVRRFEGAPRGLEGQALKWVPVGALHREDLLEADVPFVEALQRLDAAAR